MRSQFALIPLFLLSTGCAWMFKGSKQDVLFTGAPDGADVRVDGQYAGGMPTRTELSRGSAQNILVSKDGYKEQYVHLKRRPDVPWWFWDIITCVVPVTLCIPVVTDAISGAWYSLDDEVRVKLDPLPSAPAPARPAPIIPPLEYRPVAPTEAQ